MGAPLTIVVFGVCTHFGPDFEGMEQLELKSHPWLKRAHAAGLKAWWTQVQDEGADDYTLWIGDIIAHIGPEYSEAAELPPDELFSRCRAAAQKLQQAGFVTEFGQPALLMRWIPDF